MFERLTIAQLAGETGVTPAVLRSWELRHGFPSPRRPERGHRRYSREDVDAVLTVLAEREAGATLPAAIARAKALQQAAGESLFAEVRRTLEPRVVRKRTMTALSQAIEDECSARGESAVLVGAFQERRFYERSRVRWLDLARSARRAVVFADFPVPRVPDAGPAEVPIPSAKPLEREWALIYLAPRTSALLLGRELLAQRDRRDPERRFEFVWTTEPAVVRAAAAKAAEIVRRSDPDLGAALDADVAALPSAAAADGVFATALATRMIGYLDR